MKKRIVKPIVLFLVFIVAVVASSILTNKTNEDLTTAMPAATLPVICFYEGNTPVNELHGYTNKMDEAGMRDSITPVDSSRRLAMSVSTYGAKVQAISYEIRSLDGERLVADGQVEDFTTKNQTIAATLQIQNILSREEEYILIVTLDCNSRNVYYYTRLMETVECYVSECLDFALKFHDYTFREDAGDFIPTYMDPATGDATTLQYVDLTCTLKQITWADFDGQVLGKPTASFKEINDSYNVINLQYVLTSVNEAGESEYYNVEEYYRLRYTTSRMYVLNFERTMNQIFRGENNFITDSTNLLLGIRDSDVEYKESGDIISFVQEGELWCYHINDNTMVQVFSFHGAEGIDARENWDQHDIKIVRMDEAGSVDFIVYGYMNRGEHEGEVGMGIYHYDGLAHTVEEEAFLPFVRSYEILKAEMGQLMYENETGTIYLMIEGTVYGINLDTLKTRPVIEDLTEGSCAISASNRFFAWVDPDKEYSSDTIHLMDFQSGKVTDITEDSGLYLRPLGFLEEDFIYGAAASSDVAVNSAGTIDFPMRYLKIMNLADTGYELLKQYSKSGNYIDRIVIDGTTIKVNLLRQNDRSFAASGTDTIMNREADTGNRVAVESIVTDAKETEVVLTQPKPFVQSKLKMITPRSVIVENPRTLQIGDQDEGEKFYVYQKGDVLLATSSISDAIRTANDVMGVVVNGSQQYIWMRARKNAQSAFSDISASAADHGASALEKCISAMLVRNGVEISVSNMVEDGVTPKEILESSLEDKMVLDLTGCTVEELIFYVSRQSPVFALTGNNQAVLITGYNSSSIYYYHPDTGRTESMEYEEADQWFADAGSIFFTYLD